MFFRELAICGIIWMVAQISAHYFALYDILMICSIFAVGTVSHVAPQTAAQLEISQQTNMGWKDASLHIAHMPVRCL